MQFLYILALAACSIFGLLVSFAIIRPVGWSPRFAIEDAETLTFWMAALAAASCVLLGDTDGENRQMQNVRRTGRSIRGRHDRLRSDEGRLLRP